MAMAALWLVGNVVVGIPPTGPDAMDHMQWITQFTAQVDSGIWYPRWLAQSFGGFGLPVFYIYPPLAYYAAWFVHLFDHAWQAETLWRIVTTATLLLSGLTSYWYFRTYTEKRTAALFAAIVYVAIPYRYWVVLIRCAYSESLVFVFLPLLFFVIDRIIAHPSTRHGALRNIAALAVLTSLLIFTSAPSVALLSIGVPFYAIVKWLVLKPPIKPIVVQLCAAALLGLCCSAIWILPAFHFRSLVQTELAYDPGFARMYDLIAVFLVNRSNLLFVPMVMAVIGYVAIFLFWKQRRRIPREALPWLALGIAIVILQLPVSWPLWNWLPVLRVVQFSARWGILMSIAVPIAYLSMRPSRTRTALLISTALLTIVSLVHAYPTLASSWTFKGYDNHHPPKMDAFEYLPKSVEKGGWSTHLLGLNGTTPEVSVDSGDATIATVLRTATTTTIALSARTPAAITIARFYWPEWKLRRVNSLAAKDTLAIAPTHNGFIHAQIPEGRYDLSLTLERSSVEKTGAWISIVAFALVLGLFATSLRRSA